MFEGIHSDLKMLFLLHLKFKTVVRAAPIIEKEKKSKKFVFQREFFENRIERFFRRVFVDEFRSIRFSSGSKIRFVNGTPSINALIKRLQYSCLK